MVDEMATPLTSGGVALMGGPLNPVDPPPSSSSSSSPSTSSSSCLKNSALKSPILIFLFFHKAIRYELDGLHRAAMSFATEPDGNIQPLVQRYHFLRGIYKHHCNAEDEVRFDLFSFSFSRFKDWNLFFLGLVWIVF